MRLYSKSLTAFYLMSAILHLVHTIFLLYFFAAIEY